MGLAITSFSIQMFLIVLINSLDAIGKLSQGISIFSIIAFVVCLILSIISIPTSVHTKNTGSKGKGVVGMVFGIVGTVMAGIFLFVVAITFAALS